MKYKSIFLLLLFGSLTVSYGYGQAPANDEYTGAVTLTPNPDYNCTNMVAATTDGATQSPQTACHIGRNDDDVWFKFTATRGSHIVSLSDITLVRGDGTHRHIEVFKSSNGAPGDRIACTDYFDTEVLLSGLSAGENYFVRVYAYYDYNGVTARINFNICILSPPNPPANDEYTGAVTLTPNPDYNCTNAVAATTDGATQSPQAACHIGRNDDDVWFKFIATKGSHIVSLSNITLVRGGGIERHIEVFKSNSGVPGDRIACTTYSDWEVLLSGLTAGEDYFVRVYAYHDGSGIVARINFNICILTPPSPPANDEYTGAVTLTPNPDYNCTNIVAATTDGATQSLQAVCQPGRNDDDVWFKFTATRVSHIVRLSDITLVRGGGTHRYIEVFKSNSGAPGDRIACTGNADTEALLSGLNAGENYFVRVYAHHDGSGIMARINFSICILSPVDPPSNNEYANATELTVNPANDCTATTPGTTDGATKSTHDACHADNNDDVWFTFTATQASHTLRLSNITQAYGTSAARYMEVFTNVGNIPTARIFCSDNSFTETTLTGLVSGNSYYVRVYTYDILHRINFNLCILTPPIPANDECIAAVDISDGSQVSGTTNGATESLPAGTCASGIAYDVWYKVTPTSTGALTVTANTTDFNLVLEAFTGSCESLTSIACKNDADGSESLTIANAVEGTAYYFRVYNGSLAAARTTAETGSFTIQVSGTALPVTLASFKASLSESNAVRLDWATTEEAGASHFDIEHSLTGREWNKIGAMKAAGKHTDLKSYTYIHTNPSLSVNYYRLKSVDLDGSFAHSAIESINLSGRTKDLFVYPNPAGEYLSLEIGDQRSISSMQLFNIAGNEVVLKLDKAGRLLDVRHLPAGSYLLRVSRTDSSVQTFRIVIGR